MGALFGYAMVQASVDNAVTWMQKAARHDWPVLALWIAFWSAFVLISTYYQARARNARPLAPRKPPEGRVVLAPERAAIEHVRDLWSGAGEPTTGDALEILEQLDRGRANEGLSETQRFAADLRRARQSVANLFAQHDVVTIEEAAGRMENVLWAYAAARRPLQIATKPTTQRWPPQAVEPHRIRRVSSSARGRRDIGSRQRFANRLTPRDATRESSIPSPHHMSTSQRSVGADDAVIYQTGLHWVVLLPSAVAGAVFMGLGVALMRQPVGGVRPVASSAIDSGWLGILLIVIGVLAIGFGALRVESTRLTLTRHRVAIVSGVFARRSLEILLPQLESIEVNQNVLGQVLGFGTVIMRGSGGTPEALAMISKPTEFQRHVEEQTGGLQSAEAAG
jgi:hypothetical protein